jgi:hypothetical protein
MVGLWWGDLMLSLRWLVDSDTDSFHCSRSTVFVSREGAAIDTCLEESMSDVLFEVDSLCL